MVFFLMEISPEKVTQKKKKINVYDKVYSISHLYFVNFILNFILT